MTTLLDTNPTSPSRGRRIDNGYSIYLQVDYLTRKAARTGTVDVS